MKKKRTQAHVSLTIGVLFICLILFFATVLLSFALPKSPRYSESQLTAEYLEEYPRQSPPFILVDIDCLNNSEHCFRLRPEVLIGNSVDVQVMQQRVRSLIIWIDGEIRFDILTQMDGAQIYVDIPTRALASGLHLIEVQAQDKNKNFHRHQWTIRIGNGIAAPPTQALPPTMTTATP